MSSQDGYIEASSALLVVFLAAVSVSLCLYFGVNLRCQKASADKFLRQQQAERTLREIVRDMQESINDPFDMRDGVDKLLLQTKYADEKICLRDLSSGVNLNFFTEKELRLPTVANLLFVNGDPGPFIAYRKSASITAIDESLSPFVKPSSMNLCAAYGWMHKRQTDSDAFLRMAKSFGLDEPEKLFPLVNDFPLMNVNAMSPDLLACIVALPQFRIENAKRKAETLSLKISAGGVSDETLRGVLGVVGTSDIYAYLGVKTTFWELTFVESTVRVRAIVAAIPKKKGDARALDRYQIVERRITCD